MTRILIRNDDIQNTSRVVVQLGQHGEDEYVVAILGPGEECKATVDGDVKAVRIREVPKSPDTLPPPGVPV